MKKKALAIFLISAMALSLCSCGYFSSSEEEEEEAEETETTDTEEDTGAFQVYEATEQNQTTYSEADILSFELVEMDTDSSSDYVIGVYEITNGSSEDIDYLSVDFAYLDEEGNQLDTDARYIDCQLSAGKWAVMKTYYSRDGSDDIPSEIEVTGYDYIMSDIRYSVDLQLEDFDYYTVSSDEDADFDSVNILEFTLEDKGKTSSDSYQIEVDIENNGEIDVTYVSFRMAYFDDDENYLTSDSRYTDNVISPGNYATLNSYGSTDYTIGMYGIFEYSYELAEDDENGYNYYEINLQTQTVTASHVD